jgi:uncharacterized protein YfiM (DUF2279 family)
MSPRSLILGVAMTVIFVTAPDLSYASEPSGGDKALHFGVSLALASTGYWLGADLIGGSIAPWLLGGGLAVAAGVGKELWDLSGRGSADWWDLAFDLLGVAAGLLLAWGIHRVVRRIRGALRQSAAFAPS